jgi:hypothetical protein
MDPIVKAILNSLKCPQCGAGIDIKTYGPKTKGKFNYACATDNLHYAVQLATDNGLDYPHNMPIHPIIIQEMVVLYDGKHRYDINQWNASILGTVDSTTIDMFDIDPEQRIIEDRKGRKKKSSFDYPKKLFDFSRVTKEKILSRIKTILVFQ